MSREFGEQGQIPEKERLHLLWQQVDAQIKYARQIERRIKVFNVDRRAEEYVVGLDGLRFFFEYISTLGANSTMLDIGAGTTRGIYELSQAGFGQGLSYKATVLRRIRSIERFLGNERTVNTSVERLRDIPNKSIAGILGVKSISYSVAPELAVKRMNQVLIPGGAIKMTFGDRFFGAAMKAFEDFQPFLEEAGYDCFDLRDGEHGTSVTLAIKPSGPLNLTAEELFLKDFIDYYKHTPWDYKTHIDEYVPERDNFEASLERYIARISSE